MSCEIISHTDVHIFKSGSILFKITLKILLYLVVYCFLLEFLFILLVSNPKVVNANNDFYSYLKTGISTFKWITQYAILISHFNAFTKGNLPLSPYYIKYKYFHTEYAIWTCRPRVIFSVNNFSQFVNLQYNFINTYYFSTKILSFRYLQLTPRNQINISLSCIKK